MNGDFSQLDEEGHDMRPLSGQRMGHDVRVDGRRRDSGDEEVGPMPPAMAINVTTEVVVGTEMRLDYNDRLF